MKYSEGQTILNVSPVCCVLSKQFRGKFCDACFSSPTSPSSLSRCSACKAVYFCGRTCQQQLWPLHRNECAAVKALGQSQEWLPTATVRLLFYMLELYSDRSLVKIDKQDPGWKTDPFDLMSHVDNVRIDLERSEQFTQVMVSLKRICDALATEKCFQLPEVSVVLKIFGIICINGITIVDQEMTPLGTGVYLSPSALDHSCRPNCVAAFEGSRLILRSLVPIDDETEKMTINYVDLLQTREERQAQLRSQYYFTCNCLNCSSSSDSEEMKAFKCRSCNGPCFSVSSSTSKFSCSQCESNDFDEDFASSVDVALTDAQFAVEQLRSRKFDFINSEKRFKSAEQIVDIATSCLGRVSPFLHESNIFITLLADSIAESSITLSKWPVALKYARMALIGYRKHLPKNYPLLGLLLAKIGKITLYLGDHSEGDALRCLQEAENILRIAYPPDFQIVTEVHTLINQSEEELRFDLEEERRRAISGYE